MATRAYKLAEELGIDRNEFVEKAKAAGVELRNAMATLDDAQMDLLREKLGAKPKAAVSEARLPGAGGTVIRRRKKKAPAPEAEAPPEAVEPETGAPEAEPESETPVELEPAAEAPVEPEAPEAEVEPVAPGVLEEARPAPTPGAPEQPAAAARPKPRDDAAAGADRAAQSRKQFKEVVNLREQEQIARQVTSRTGRSPARPSADTRSYSAPRRKRRDAPAKKQVAAAAEPNVEKKVVKVEGQISVGELAKQLGAKAAQVQGKLMALGTMVSMNQTIAFETAERVALEFGFEVQNTGFQESEFLEAPPEAGALNLEPRPAVVTVMGHVDHGKTSLLDALREANVVAGEAGGITQHIGAYQVEVGGQKLTFIDTPGHEAFTAMRARGAQVTDIVILVVAASEGIMPQTIEAIDHARAAEVPIIVAVNKCDLPDANPQTTRQRLMEHNIVVEDFGGEVLAIDVSATQRTNLDKLLEAVALQAELVEPKADPSMRGKGIILEAELEKGRGPVGTVLVQEGTLQRGDIVVTGTEWGRIRTMTNERGETLKEAGPSTPVQVVGLSGVPAAGDTLYAVESERVAKEIVSHREDLDRTSKGAPSRPRVSLEDLFAQSQGDGPLELNLIVKADTQGSAGALGDSLRKLPQDKVTLDILHSGVGGITERDVQLAEASKAIIIGFHVRPDSRARRLAEDVGVDIRVYQIIYEVVDQVKAAMAGLLPPTKKEVVLGQAQVRETFHIPKVGTVAGCYITEGMVRRNAKCRVVRDGVQIFEGDFASLRRFKDDVREVQTGFECGIGIQGFNDVKIGDVIEVFDVEEQAAEL